MEFKIYRAKEDELIKGCIKRNRNAQQQLFDLYSGKMYAVCYRYVREAMEAEDILVTAFTKIFERIDQFKGEGSFEGWIRRIIVNESLTYIRRNRAMYVETELDQADRQVNYEQLDDHLAEEDLLNMIQQLPSGYRVVFNMYAIDGYSHKEIAEHLGISENTSKSQLSRARTYLQKLLADQEWISKSKSGKDESATR
ncbi:RNA polymerase sigma factor [Chryseosolibacter indicus]|uniref:Sigma-70 family RNA polymerase sigma factor n=1 Tax=Chryseosolibacter indicus TaxID=2782351 RepID=A0ABS5VLP3_9BACT|nr:sigma-70 family RNA polymerase sigma factor [Chryseosolibacter indicus]MBT1702372.1 sigma-70 family RNA polymerase sigma factor [Chryseosolibacter indicus]